MKDFFMKKHINIGFCTLFAVASITGHAQTDNHREFGSPQVRMAQAMAIADGVTTYYGLHHKDGLIEANPLMPSSKGGIVAITALKVGVITYYDHYGSPNQRDKASAIMSGTFGGATINNLAVISGADKSVAIGAGVLGGVGLYYINRKLANKYNNKHQLIATNNGIGYQYAW